MKIRKNDNVIVISGKDKGKTGKVLSAFPKMNKVIVEGINICKRHEKSKKKDSKGEVVDVAMPLSVSNVAIVDPKDKKAVRVGFMVEGEKKIRIAKRSGQKID